MRKDAKISKSILFDKIGYKPHSEEQWAAHNSQARFRIPTCGRRWGKSTFASRELLHAMFIPESHYWIVGPNYALAEKEFRIVYRDLMQKLGMEGLRGVKRSYNVKQGDMRIELPWNTVLEAKSADRPDGLVGEGLDGVIVAESALHPSQIWQMYLEPALSDKRGWAIFPSTPRGYNWYQGLWMMGQDSEFRDYESWRFPSWTNKVSFPLGYNDPEIQRIKATVSKAHFLQEYAAEFTAFEGQIYEEFDPAFHVTDIEYNPAWTNIRTFDFGFRDPTVCLDVMVDPMDNAYIWREYQVRGMNTWEHGQAIRARPNPDGYHVDMQFADPRGTDEISTLSMLLGNIYAPDVPWIQGIEAVQRLIKIQPDGSTKFQIDRSCVETIRQFEQLRHKTVKEGHNVRTEGQHDYDDHGPDCFRYFAGPYYVLGANSHLSDVYGTSKQSTEGSTFFKLHKGFTKEISGTPF